MTGEDGREYMPLSEAFQLYKQKGFSVSHLTFINQVKKWEITKQPGGKNTKLFVDREKFEEKLNG